MPQQLLNPAKVTEVFAHLNETPDNRALYSELASGNEVTADVRAISLAPGYRIVRVDDRKKDEIPQDHFELALVNDLTEEVVYYNRVIIQPDSFLNCRPVTQILVWRTQKPKHRAVLHDFAGIIFMNYLLERYDIIVSDRNQTHEGMSFWQARMYDALALGLHLYAYDMITCELREMKNESDLEKGETWLWGDKDHFQNRLAIISKHELPI
ncbi:hypothetical protein DZA65_03183 [Dickeya dianthicola]|uniref:hypothetical protein n=1 Tax=Dickeya dianthicola TaxID=204039 RepID=UPI000CD3FA8B|nr:hypothetical protein [Dickeya dianthicola]AYC20058.1 hypothetical protein DZA65_03183 [Dickeya dianthicola]MBI0437105.1 hypothetical protein [Dickeya dianthicola]MBI0448639.1 hypothetical protein [Dickeya dianthicola]MBI0452066.1 hypothetical protein [Dickeya dianthicola]MBI0456356.1 hypothetical protein [Dickeya dianthicola]